MRVKPARMFPGVALALAVCALLSSLVGCGGGDVSAPGGMLPVTSGTRLLFDTFGVGENALPDGIDILSPDGSQVQQAANTPGGAMPRFSADGTKIAYVGGSGISFLVVSDVDGSNGVSLPTGESQFPAFRPDGKTLVYVDGGKLFTQDIHPAVPITNSAQLHKIYTPPLGYFANRPVYTPDGNHIVFEQDPNPATSDAPKVYIIHADGGERRQIGGNYAITPAVSPDGKHIAYSGPTNSNNGLMGLYITNSDGTGQPVGPFGLSASHPVFSPDGTKIAYLSQVNSNASINGSPTYEIHITNSDGTGDTRVGTKLTVGTYSLDWR